MSNHILSDGIPDLLAYLSQPGMPPNLLQGLKQILDSAYDFSRMLHASKSSSGGQSGGADAFYRSFIPELGSVLYPRQIELLKRCRKHETGEVDRVGACVFPVSFTFPQIQEFCSWEKVNSYPSLALIRLGSC